MKEFRIALIGAGETGTPLLGQLLAAPFVKMLGVADLDEQSPGMVLARQHGVHITTDFTELAAIGEELDILIDVTGKPEVRELLRKQMIDSGNRHTLIMHELISLLMLSLSAGKLVESKHVALDYHA